MKKVKFLISIEEIGKKLESPKLNYFEKADVLARIRRESTITQTELALLLGKSQAYISNKLRLLTFSEEVRQEMILANLSERHARALLRLRKLDNDTLISIVRKIERKKINVNKLETMIYNYQFAQLSTASSGTKEETSYEEKTSLEENIRNIVSKNLRAFGISMRESVAILRENGIYAKTLQYERGEYFEFSVRIPKKQYKNVLVDKVDRPGSRN